MSDFETRRDALVVAALRLYDVTQNMSGNRYTQQDTLERFSRACERYREVTARMARCDTPQENCTDDHT